MKAKHTPGPWKVGTHRYIDSPGGTICETYSHMGTDKADANERLIAAAPELLSALLGLIDAIKMGDTSQLAFNMPVALAAVAKATGETK